jgi:hypothetical protein
MSYKVVTAQTLSDLTTEVEELLQTGWILVGGIAFNGKWYLQAMTRTI